MPNGHAEERDWVRAASPFWGAVWRVGDCVYYLGFSPDSAPLPSSSSMATGTTRSADF